MWKLISRYRNLFLPATQNIPESPQKKFPVRSISIITRGSKRTIDRIVANYCVLVNMTGVTSPTTYMTNGSITKAVSITLIDRYDLYTKDEMIIYATNLAWTCNRYFPQYLINLVSSITMVTQYTTFPQS